MDLQNRQRRRPPEETGTGHVRLRVDRHSNSRLSHDTHTHHTVHHTRTTSKTQRKARICALRQLAEQSKYYAALHELASNGYRKKHSLWFIIMAILLGFVTAMMASMDTTCTSGDPESTSETTAVVLKWLLVVLNGSALALQNILWTKKYERVAEKHHSCSVQFQTLYEKCNAILNMRGHAEEIAQRQLEDAQRTYTRLLTGAPQLPQHIQKQARELVFDPILFPVPTVADQSSQEESETGNGTSSSQETSNAGSSPVVSTDLIHSDPSENPSTRSSPIDTQSSSPVYDSQGSQNDSPPLAPARSEPSSAASPNSDPPQNTSEQESSNQGETSKHRMVITPPPPKFPRHRDGSTERPGQLNREELRRIRSRFQRNFLGSRRSSVKNPGTGRKRSRPNS